MASIKREKKDDGTVVYRVRVVVGYKPDGSPIQKMRSFHSRKEAEAWGRAAETDRDRGQAVDVSKLRTGEYLDQYLTRAQRRVRPSTLHGYRGVIERAIRPALGGLRLRDLTRATLQRWIDGLATPDTAHRARHILHAALAEAVDLELLVANPAVRLKLPPRQLRTGVSWTKEEARAFLAAAAGQTYWPYWPLAVRLGLRPSELLGLRWPAVDLEVGTLSVVEARPTVGGYAFAGGPKSLHGARTLDLPADVVQLLRAHKAAQNARRLALGPLWQGEDLVCCGRHGPIPYRELGRSFARLCAHANIRPIRLYDLRHTAISLMAEAGADFKAISEVAGHADVRITRSVYQHVNRAQRRAALAALGQALGEPETEPKSAAL